MIDPRLRLFAGSGNLLNGGPYTWHITDLDQRRHFGVTYDPPVRVQDVEETEPICMAQLQKHVDQLEDGVLGIRFSEPDGPITKSTELKDDVTWLVNCFPLEALGVPFPLKTITLANLTELDRFASQVDLVSYQSAPSASGDSKKTKAVFKYWFMDNGMFRTWYELNSWSRLPRDHPHIIPFDAVVLDHIRGGIVGFTSLYIPGGTLEDTATTRPFRLEWFRQLLSVVDDLNYRYGMMHQDIAARNLIIDEDEKLRLFDFNYSIMIGEHYTPDRDDAKGVTFTLYEIITLDEHFRDVPHDQQDAEALLGMGWTKHPDVKLDSDVWDFREVLDAWLATRKTKTFTPSDTWIRWPWMPKPPLGPTSTYGPDGKVTGKKMEPVHILIRNELVQMNEPFWKWERPASYLLMDTLKKEEAGADAKEPVSPGTKGEDSKGEAHDAGLKET